MRVIAGTAKGRRLKAPRQNTRPTSSLVREAIFSILASSGADLSRVLDLYAGSGALGIEALSRGASWGDFVEQSRLACAIIRENLKTAGFQNQAQVHCMTVEQALPGLTGLYTLVLADPPYTDASALVLLEGLAASTLVEVGRTPLVLEHSSRLPTVENIGLWRLLKTRRHGDTAVSIYS